MKKIASLMAVMFISTTLMMGASSLESRDVQSNMEMSWSCFDFYDSCGGAWEVCHQGVSIIEVIDFLWNWDGGC